MLRAAIGNEQALATQLRDGTVVLRGPSEESGRPAPPMLAVDDDHTEFLRRFRRTFLRGAIAHFSGLRVPAWVTVAHALLRALAGQLIESRRARAIEKAIIRKLSPKVGTSTRRRTARRLAARRQRSCARWACTRAAARPSRVSAARSSSSG